MKKKKTRKKGSNLLVRGREENRYEGKKIKGMEWFWA